MILIDPLSYRGIGLYDPNRPLSYRGIGLLSCIGKVYNSGALRWSFIIILNMIFDL